MTCYRPLMAWRNPNAINPETGKSAILFSPPENWRDCEPIKVPCGQCGGFPKVYETSSQKIRRRYKIFSLW